MQYIRKIDHLLFAESVITSGLETNGGSLKDEKLGYYDSELDVHYDNTLVADQRTLTQAGFIQSEWKGNKWVLSTGLRYDHYKVGDKSSTEDDVNGNVLSPRVSFFVITSYSIHYTKLYDVGTNIMRNICNVYTHLEVPVIEFGK